MNLFARIRDVLFPAITRARFDALRAQRPKRVCFGSTHQSALKRSEEGRAVGFLNVPFSETLEEVLPVKIFKSKGQFGGYYRAIKNEAEFAEVAAWVQRHRELVFLRSLLSTAVALCEHYAEEGKRSRIGDLENRAKYLADNTARLELSELLLSSFSLLHCNRRIDAICAVPSSTPGNASLPVLLAARLAEAAGIPDITPSLRWKGVKDAIKEADVDSKWDRLESVGLQVDSELRGKNVLIIDDMYQSGATVHFLAAQLRESGADDIHCLAVSKGRRDTDNK